MGVLDKFLECLLGVFGTVGVLVVLDAVNLYPAVVFRECEPVLPGLLIGLDGIDNQIFLYKL